MTPEVKHNTYKINTFFPYPQKRTIVVYSELPQPAHIYESRVSFFYNAHKKSRFLVTFVNHTKDRKYGR